MLWTREMGEIGRALWISTKERPSGIFLTTLGKAVARGLREAGWGGETRSGSVWERHWAFQNEGKQACLLALSPPPARGVKTETKGTQAVWPCEAVWPLTV